MMNKEWRYTNEMGNIYIHYNQTNNSNSFLYKNTFQDFTYSTFANVKSSTLYVDWNHTNPATVIKKISTLNQDRFKIERKKKYSPYLIYENTRRYLND